MITCKRLMNRFMPSVTQSSSAIRSPENPGSTILPDLPTVRDASLQTTFSGQNTLRRFYRHFNRKSFRHDRCFNRFTRQAPAPGRDRLYVIYHPSRLSCRLLSGCHADEYQITFDKKTGRLYGGQIVGYDGVDKRIDELALVIKHEGTIYDLMKVEQAYAPPFSSAKDPVALAGYVAEDIITGKTNPVYWRELRDIEMEISSSWMSAPRTNIL